MEIDEQVRVCEKCQAPRPHRRTLPDGALRCRVCWPDAVVDPRGTAVKRFLTRRGSVDEFLDQIRKAAIVVVALVGGVGLLSLVVWCRGRDREEHHYAEPGVAPAAATPAPVAAPPPAPSGKDAWLDQKPAPEVATIKFPTLRGFKIGDVLGHTRSEVEAVLGHGEQIDDGHWIYSSFKPLAPTVCFSAGRAAEVMLMFADRDRSSLSAADLQAALHWLRADDTAIAEANIGTIDVWTDASKAAYGKRQILAIAMSDADGSTVSARMTTCSTMEISVPPGDESCTMANLRKVAATYSLASRGVDRVECRPPGSFDVVTLRLR
jgi:hypothetical protein